MTKSIGADPDAAVKKYRKLCALRESATGAEHARLDGEIQQLRDAWKQWQGEDCLHETAFGEPQD
jgi:hypothetical protein